MCKVLAMAKMKVNSPYKIQKSEWIDDVDLWPGVMYILVGMILLLVQVKRRPVELQELC